MLFLVLSFGVFLTRVPKHAFKAMAKHDAIIVFTGGSQRITRGIELLEANKADVLFISGVGVDVDVPHMIKDLPEALLKRIQLGPKASDTASNARESQEWMDQNSIETVYLVTSNYHMPRAMLEFRARNPNIIFTPMPVIAHNVKIRAWWQYPGTFRLLVSEYCKIWAIRMGFKPKGYGEYV